MSIGLCYWILILLALVGGLWATWPAQPKLAGGTLLLFILLVLIGYRLFGPPIHG